MFSGLTNQISGWVANKTGGAADPNADPNAAAAGAAPVDPNDPNAQYQQNGAEGAEGAPPPGGMSGLAQGLMMKAMAAKSGMQEKAGAIAANSGNITAMGAGMLSNVTQLIPGQKREEEVPPVDPNAQMVDPNAQGYEQQAYDETQYQEQVQYQQ